MSDNILPVPKTTEESGSSAITTGSPVSIISRLSRFFSRAPPPVRTIPRSTMSAESSGGVRSRATRTALMIVETASERAFADLLVGHRDRLRNTLDKISAANVHR
jgi:hypothetical protein